MGENWAPLIDPHHFLGRSAFDIHYPKNEDTPSASLQLRGELFVLKIEVPDYKREELQIEVKNNMLFIRGSKENNITTSDPKFVPGEMRRDSFEKIFRLAPSIAREGVNAEYKDGILWVQFIDVPKEKEAGSRKVAIV